MKNTGLLADYYRDEDAARAHLEAIRWPDGPVCPHCGLVNEAYRLNGKKTRKGLWKCSGCRKQFTVTVKTIFEDSHIPIHKWLLAIHLMCSSKKGISAHQLMRNLEFKSYRTAWFMAHRIRWALTQEPIKGMLGGIVEIDECYIGGKLKGGYQRLDKVGRPQDYPSPTSNKTPVVAVLQRGGSVRSQVVERVTVKNLKPIVNDMVRNDAHVMTDSSSILASAKSHRKHSQVNHSEGEYSRLEAGTCVTTNSVESYFAILKRGNYGVYHHWGKKYIAQYLREFDWRYNVRSLPDFERTLVALKMSGGKRLMLRPQKNEKR